jgi:hypothetical protein
MDRGDIVSRWRIAGVVALVAILGTAWIVVVWPRVHGAQMESFCGALPIGMKVEDARSLAEKQGYLFMSPSTTGRHPAGLILDTKAGGGFGCEFRRERRTDRLR